MELFKNSKLQIKFFIAIAGIIAVAVGMDEYKKQQIENELKVQDVLIEQIKIDYKGNVWAIGNLEVDGEKYLVDHYIHQIATSNDGIAKYDRYSEGDTMVVKYQQSNPANHRVSGIR